MKKRGTFMKNRLTVCLLFVLCLLTACGEKKDELNLFFAWTQGYLASPVNEENTIALTFYENKQTPAFDLSEIEAVRLDGFPVPDISFEYELSPIDVESRDEYQPYALSLAYTPSLMGVYAVESVTFILKDTTQLTYPVGRIVFDIGPAESHAIDTWESPIASSNPNDFPYQYSLYSSEAKLTKLQIGESKILAAAEGLPIEGKVSLKDSYSAPLVIIRSKLSVDQNGEIITAYGKGCYCGAINTGNSIFEQSFKYWTS